MTDTKVKKKTTKKTVDKKETVKKEAKVHEKKENHEAKHTSAKTETKKEVKVEKKEAIKEEKKEVKKKIYIKKVKKENKTKSSEAKSLQEVLKNTKKRIPTFRGRFGKANIRRLNKAKWTKWRRPRGIDLDKGLNHGFRPKTGYRNEKKIRGTHPSGYIEVRVENVNQLEQINNKTQAIKIGSTVGKRKRNQIVESANKKGIWILN